MEVTEVTEATKATKAWTVGPQRTRWQAVARAEVADVVVVAAETGEAEVIFFPQYDYRVNH